MNMLDFYGRKMMECEKEIKELDFVIESIHFGYEKGIIKSKKIYKHYLETYKIKKKELQKQQDEYYMKMIRLEPVVSSKYNKNGNALLGGVV